MMLVLLSRLFRLEIHQSVAGGKICVAKPGQIRRRNSLRKQCNSARRLIMSLYFKYRGYCVTKSLLHFCSWDTQERRCAVFFFSFPRSKAPFVVKLLARQLWSNESKILPFYNSLSFFFCFFQLFSAEQPKGFARNNKYHNVRTSRLFYFYFHSSRAFLVNNIFLAFFHVTIPFIWTRRFW